MQMIRFLFLTLFFLIIFLSGFTQTDTGKVYIKGIDTKVKYTRNRQIGQASFLLINTSKNPVTVSLLDALLLQGVTEESLKNSQFEYFNQKTIRDKSLTLKARARVQSKVVFKPFPIYTGSRYAVKAVISTPTGKLEAVSKIEIMKLGRIDPNRYHNVEK